MKRAHIIALIFIGISIALIVALTADYSTYETFTSAEKKPGKEFHIVGELSRQEEMYYDPLKDPNYFSFYMKDKDGVERKVVFKGAKPQDFERSEQIVLTGKMKGEEFAASKILIKCPSKYIQDELEVSEVSANSSI
jgi:cytochrome c-type biogenesis protein CcmE